MNELLFVYGIFLDLRVGRSFGLGYDREAGRYSTVRDWATVGEHIVSAVPAPGFTLTGLVVTVPERAWVPLDSLEAAYKRIAVTTEGGLEAFMYADRSAPGADHSTRRVLERIGA